MDISPASFYGEDSIRGEHTKIHTKNGLGSVKAQSRFPILGTPVTFRTEKGGRGIPTGGLISTHSCPGRMR